MSREEAKLVANTLISDPERALDTLAREELAINPDEQGSAWGTAISSFITFCTGASIPLLPFVYSTGQTVLQGVIIATAFSLFIVGA